MSGNTTKIPVRVQPNASRSELAGFTEGVLQARVAAPPVKSKANKELVTLLSQILGVSKSQLIITKGYNSRLKVIAIDGLNRAEVMKRLSP